MKGTDKRIKISLAVCSFVIAGCFLYYCFSLKPREDALIDTAKNYLKISNTVWVLPKEYRSCPENMNDEEITNFKDDIKKNLIKYIEPKTKLFSEAFEKSCELVDKQIDGSIKITDVKGLKINGVKEKRISKNTASIIISIDSGGKLYKIFYEKQNDEWKIKEIEPVDL